MIFRTFSEYCLVQEMAARKQLSRILGTAKDTDRFYALISAFRGGKEEPGATKRLEADIRAKGFGVAPMVGGYDENGIDVRENSLLVSLPKTAVLPPREETIDFFLQLADKYGQAGVVVRFPGEPAHEYTTRHHQSLGQGRKIAYNDPRADDEPMYYTRPRYRGTSKNSVVSKRDGVVFNPDFDNPMPLLDKPNGDI